MTPPALRRATAADVPAIALLTRAAYGKWVPLIGREPMPMVADHALAVAQHRVDLLHEGETLVGLIETIAGPDHLLIESVAVAPEAQGRGHGGALMAHAERLAVGLGVAELRLYTNKAFAANLPFYEHLGYRTTREEPFRGGITVYMSKQLAGAT